MKQRKITAEQKEKATKRRAKFRELCEMVAGLSPEARVKYAEKAPIMTPEGHVLSGTNQTLVMLQYPDATIVGGFHQWRKIGRVVMKGEVSLNIWIPTKRTGAEEKDNSSANPEQAARDEKPGFIMGCVFDITQTIPYEAE